MGIPDGKRSGAAELAADRRKQILKAAIEVFAERGFHRTRVSDIAKLQAIAALLIDALRIAPSIIQVIIQEISRSDRFVQARKVAAFQDAFAIVREIISAGQSAGEIKSSIDPQVGAYIFFGALETICTGFLLKSIACATNEEAERVKRTVCDVLLAGMEDREAKLGANGGKPGGSAR